MADAVTDIDPTVVPFFRNSTAVPLDVVRLNTATVPPLLAALNNPSCSIKVPLLQNHHCLDTK